MQTSEVAPLALRQFPQFCPQVELSAGVSQVLVFRLRILPAAHEVQLLGALRVHVMQEELQEVQVVPLMKAPGQQVRHSAGWSVAQVRQVLEQGLQ